MATNDLEPSQRKGNKSTVKLTFTNNKWGNIYVVPRDAASHLMECDV